MKIDNSITKDKFERIEQYLLNRMPDSERIAFETQLASDFTLKQKVEDLKILLEGIETESLKEKLNTFHEDLTSKIKPLNHTSETKTVSISWYKKYGIAASIILLLGLGFLWIINQDNTQKLYTKYYTPDPGLPSLMSSDNDSNFQFNDAMVTYKQGDYKTAISKWNVLLEPEPKNDTLNYFIGSAYLANKQATTAITYLEKVSTYFKDEANYYLGLAHLKNDNIQLAKKYLNFSTIDDSKALLLELND